MDKKQETMTELLPDIFCIEIPEGSKPDDEISKGPAIFIFHTIRPIRTATRIPLPSGKWSILFTSKDAGEEDWKGVVNSYGNGMYFDYSLPVWFGYKTLPSESGLSLLTSKGLDTNKNYLIIKKEKE